ncbi:MAG TPA: response regulator [Thermoanaerobaculia bacterium]
MSMTEMSMTEMDETMAMTSICRVQCKQCSARFDAMTAPWCRCVTKKISVACPECRFCLCKASQAAVTSFWFNAPQPLVQRRRDEQARRAAAAAMHRPEDKTTVLIVDDDEEIRLIAEYALQQMGYQTVTAPSADAALEVLAKTRPDVVLTDALMPKTDGRELCRLIKERDAALKVVVMTSLYTGTRYRNEGMTRFRADEYLAKPIDFTQLQTILEKLVPKAA